MTQYERTPKEETIGRNWDTQTRNPVIKKEDGWYFFDETWSFLEGPYPSEKIAREELKNYAQHLDKE